MFNLNNYGEAIPEASQMKAERALGREERERIIAPRVEAITRRCISQAFQYFPKYSSVCYLNIEKADSGKWDSPDYMKESELIELADSIADLFKSKGYKVSVQSFSKGYKILRRIEISLK